MHFCRGLPPQLLYIGLPSFDELRLAMNACMPLVRPLLCYACRGFSPMHQKALTDSFRPTTLASEMYHEIWSTIRSQSQINTTSRTTAMGSARVTALWHLSGNDHCFVMQ